MSGTTCKVTCPECDTVKALSSFANKTTGNVTFSIHNFSRHYIAHSTPLKQSGNHRDAIYDSNTSTDKIGDDRRSCKWISKCIYKLYIYLVILNLYFFCS